MKAVKPWLLCAVVALAFMPQTSRAGLITGDIGFAGLVSLDTSSASTATTVTGWNYTTVFECTGSYTNFITTPAPVTFSDAMNWDFNTTSPITNFWTVGGFRFELLSSYIVAQVGTPGSGFLNVVGNGVVSGNGFTPTTCTWTLATQDPSISGPSGPVWTFSASDSIMNGSNGEPVLVSKAIPYTNAVVLSWSDPTFTLQSAPAVSGPFSNVQGATSPYTNILSGTQRFFRLNQ